VTLLHASDFVACKWLCCMLHLALHVDNQVSQLDTQVTLLHASDLVTCFTIHEFEHVRCLDEYQAWSHTHDLTHMILHAWSYTLQSTELYVESSLVMVLGAELSSHVHYSPAMYITLQPCRLVSRMILPATIYRALSAELSSHGASYRVMVLCTELSSHVTEWNSQKSHASCLVMAHAQIL